ncbi:hypothetical protein NBRC116494_27340 [Aurantivibrio plasticivorans]
MSDSFWSRYREALNPAQDAKEVLMRMHDRHATLDGVRAITVLLMVMFHVLFGIVVLFDKNEALIDKFITEFPRYLGWMWQSQGSDPLFVMCGLLVSYTFFREFDRTGTLQIKQFYIKRLKRVMPLFIIALLIYLPTDKDNLGHLWSNLIFMSNYIPGERHVIPVGWSLDVQMHFYFVLPFLVLAMYKFKHHLAFLIGLCVIAFVWRYWVVAHDPEVYETPFYQIIYDSDFGSKLANLLYYDIDVRMGTFFLGMVVAYIYHYYGHELKIYFRRHVALSAFLTLLGTVLLVGSMALPMDNKYHPFFDDFSVSINFWFLVADRYVYSLGLSILIVMALVGSGPARWLDWMLSWKIWHPVAQLIFPIYLFHFPFIVIAAVLTFWTTDRHAIVEVQTYEVFLLFFWTVALTLPFSLFTHIFVEKPFINMRSRGEIPKVEKQQSLQVAPSTLEVAEEKA